jgi:urease accessory protein
LSAPDDLGRTHRRLARSAVGAALALAAPAALAHSTAQGIGDFYAGFLHPLTAPEHVLPFFALGVLAAQQSPRGQLALPLFWVAVIAGAALALLAPGIPGVDFANILSALVLGGLIALNARLPRALLFALAAVFGLTHGIANGTVITGAIRPYLFIPGLGLAALMTSGYGLVFTDWLLRRKATWIPIAVRVGGSWIAAIGMLVLASSWKTLTAG